MNIYTQLLIIILVAAAVIGVLVWFILKYKHRFIVHEITGSKCITHVIKFREVADRNGNTWWLPINKRFGKKLKPAPNRARMVTNKGRISIEATWSKSYQFQYIVPQQNTPVKGKSDYEVLTDDQKSIYLEEMRDSQQWKKPSASDLIMKFAGIGAVLILVIALMIFYGDMAKPLIEMSGSLQGFQQKQLEMMEMFQEVIQNKQWIQEGAVIIRETEIPANFTPPS